MKYPSIASRLAGLWSNRARILEYSDDDLQIAVESLIGC